MGQYIIFNNESHEGVNGYFYQKGVKYKIKSSDTKYYYVMSDKIQKNSLDNVDYTIDQIKG